MFGNFFYISVLGMSLVGQSCGTKIVIVSSYRTLFLGYLAMFRKCRILHPQSMGRVVPSFQGYLTMTLLEIVNILARNVLNGYLHMFCTFWNISLKCNSQYHTKNVDNQFRQWTPRRPEETRGDQ